MADWQKNNLINELIQGRELTRQLRSHFHCAPTSSESREMQDLLIFRILLSYDRTLSMLNWDCSPAGLAGTSRGAVSRSSGRRSESPPSLGDSPRSGGEVDRDNRERDGNEDHLGDSRSNRKVMTRWTKRVRVTSGRFIEQQLDDGLSWRKYGQKDILGARFPRGYYRCTHKSTQGCLATKQVQQSDEDPSVFEISYRGKHTCSIPFVGTNPPSPSPEIQEPHDALAIAVPPPKQQQNQHQSLKDRDSLLDFYQGLAMLTDSSMKDPPTPFDLPSISDNTTHTCAPTVTSDFNKSLTGFELFRESQNLLSLDHSELGLVVSAANLTTISSGTDTQVANAGGNLELTFGLGESNGSFGNRGFLYN